MDDVRGAFTLSLLSIVSCLGCLRMACAANRRKFITDNIRRHNLSRLMGKPTICICENKDADQLRGNREADHAFVFAKWIVQFLLYLYPKFQASSILLCLCSSVCVGPVQKPHCWFSHEVAHFIADRLIKTYYSNLRVP